MASYIIACYHINWLLVLYACTTLIDAQSKYPVQSACHFALYEQVDLYM